MDQLPVPKSPTEYGASSTTTGGVISSFPFFRRFVRVMSPRILRALVIMVAAAASTIPVAGQRRSRMAPRAFTAAEYARAERFMSWNTTPLVFRNAVTPTWIADDH